MKKFIKNNLLGFLIGIILCSGVVCGINLYRANDILYTTSDGVKTNVNEALDYLYNMKQELDALKSIGNAISSDIVKDKIAVVKGEIIVGTAAGGTIQKLERLDSKYSEGRNVTQSVSCSATIPAGYGWLTVANYGWGCSSTLTGTGTCITTDNRVRICFGYANNSTAVKATATAGACNGTEAAGCSIYKVTY